MAFGALALCQWSGDLREGESQVSYFVWWKWHCAPCCELSCVSRWCIVCCEMTCFALRKGRLGFRERPDRDANVPLRSVMAVAVMRSKPVYGLLKWNRKY